MVVPVAGRSLVGASGGHGRPARARASTGAYIGARAGRAGGRRAWASGGRARRARAHTQVRCGHEFHNSEPAGVFKINSKPDAKQALPLARPACHGVTPDGGHLCKHNFQLRSTRSLCCCWRFLGNFGAM